MLEDVLDEASSTFREADGLHVNVQVLLGFFWSVVHRCRILFYWSE